MDDASTPENGPESTSGSDGQPTLPIPVEQPTQPTEPIYGAPPAPSQPTQPIYGAPAQPVPAPPMPNDPWSIPPAAAIVPPPEPQPPAQPTQPYGDPYAGSVWGAGAPEVAAVPPVVDPWLPPGGVAMGPRDVLSDSTPGARNRQRRPGVMLVAAALLGGLISAAGVSAVVIATRPANDSSNGTFSSAPASSTSNTSINQSRPAGTVAAVAQAVLPSVVSILESNGQEAGEGSGIILDTDGHILTNNHVVADVASGGTLTVTFQDGSSSKATIVGRDPATDIAVIKVNGKTGLKPATLGSSASLQVGDQVVAIGSPLGLSGTVTEGIVSALNRPVLTAPDNATSNSDEAAISAIQTDAAINPGNSGGALVDADGEVVGVNSAIATVAQTASGTQAGNIGVGFAIPIDQAKRIATEILAGKKVTHALLGTTVARTESELTTVGAKLQSVTSGSAADKAGLKAGDVVDKVNGEIVQGSDGLVATIRSFAPGTTVQITYTRAGATHTINVVLGSDAANS